MRRALGLLFLLWVCSGCSLLLADAEQCAIDDDCAKRGLTSWRCEAKVCVPATGDWSCLGNRVEPEQTPYTLFFEFINYVSKARVPVTKVEACNRLDVECAEPLEGLAVRQDEGLWRVSVLGDFFGYLKVHSESAITTLVFVNPYLLPTYETYLSGEFLEVPLVDQSMLAGIALAGGVVVDPEAGHVFVGIRDCVGERAAGVTVQLAEGQYTSLTFQGGIPTTEVRETDEEGVWGALNAPSGFNEVEAFLGVEDVFVGALPILIRPEHITVTYVSNAPR